MSLFLANACELLQIENSTPFTDIIRMWSIGDLEYSNYTIRKSNFFILKILILTRRFLCPHLKSIMTLPKSKKSFPLSH